MCHPYRFGKFNRVLDAGLHFLVPLVRVRTVLDVTVSDGEQTRLCLTWLAAWHCAVLEALLQACCLEKTLLPDCMGLLFVLLLLLRMHICRFVILSLLSF
jgi:hypothetical protein